MNIRKDIDMKKLIIAEKPKLAANCVAALSLIGESLQRENGYYEGSDYIVSYCIGHLLELYEIADYTGEKDWRKTALPYIPDEFKFRVKEDTSAQYEIVAKLIKRHDVSEIYHLGDADREGEVIVRNVLYRAGNIHPVMRVWTDDQTETAIKEALLNVRPDEEYDNLYQEGLARTYMDWLYGINLTRYLTLRTNAKPPLRVGRVLIPIVKKIYDREMEIRNFVPEQFLQAEGTASKDNIQYTLVLSNRGKQKPDEEIRAIVDRLNQANTVVTHIEKDERVVNRPRLFNLGKAQSRIAKLHKIGMSESLGCIQALYESGYLTYPRTDSEYLAETEAEKVDEIINRIKEVMPEANICQQKSVYNNSRVIGHSALRPTHKLPEQNVYEELVQTARQKAGGNAVITAETVEKCYTTILNRFMAAFAAEEHLIASSEVIIHNGEYEFVLKGQVTIKKGFTIYDNTVAGDKGIPDFAEGECLPVRFEAVKKMTTPPKRLTVESLNNYLINPFKSEVDDDYKAITDGLSLGTQATRTGIIKNAMDSQYIDCKNNTYFLLDRGEYLVDTINALGIDLYKNKTAELNRLLISVQKSEIDIKEVIEHCDEELKNEICAADSVTDIRICEDEEKVLYKCPFCNGGIVKGQYGFFCKDSKDFSFSHIRGVEVTDAMMSAFMSRKKVLVKGLKSDKGTYEAYIIPNGWEKRDKYTNLIHTLEFRKGGKNGKRKKQN